MRAPVRLLAAVLAAACAATAAPARADEVGDDLEDLLGGFEDGNDEPEEPSETLLEEIEDSSFWSWWDLGGDLLLSTSVNYLSHRSAGPAPNGTQWGGLSKLRTKLGLELDGNLPADWRIRVDGYVFYDFMYIINDRNYTRQVLNNYEWDIQLQEAYLAGSLHKDFDIKIGRQIVNWGRSDSLRVLDVINPLDNREPGLADIEDLKLGVAMIRGDYYRGPWSITGLVIPEVRFSFLPTFGHDFNPSPVPLPSERKPSSPEYGLAVNGIFKGWDVSFNLASYYEDIAFLNPSLTQLTHDRLLLLGGGGNYTAGSWLFKTELAWIDGFDYFNVTDEKSRTDFMVGVEYYGITDWNFSLEIVNRHINDFDSVLKLFPDGQQKNAMETAARITANFLNERLQMTLLGLILGPTANDGSIVRLDATYDLRDALELGGGIVFYQKGDLATFQNIRRNDRIFFEIRYSF
jgi:hypothetical protein